MVEDVEELGSELESLVLTHLRALDHREVEDDVAWSMEHVATEATESSRTKSQRCSGTDPVEEWIGCRGCSTATRSVEGAIWSAITRIGITWIEELHGTADVVRAITSRAGK